MFCVFFTGSVKAQSEIEALKAKLANPVSDSVRLETWSLLAKNYRFSDKAISKKYVDSVKNFVDVYERANSDLKRYHLLFKANALTTLSNLEFDKRNLDESIRLNLECVKIYEKLDLPSLISVSLSNIGAIFLNLGKNEDAIRYLKKSSVLDVGMLELYPDNVTLQISAADTYINLGGVYAKIGQADSSILYHEKALRLYAQSNNNEGVASCYSGLVNGYRMRREFSKALKYAQKALDMFLKMNSSKEISFSYLFFSDIYLDMKNYKKALQYSDSVEKICLKNNYVDNLMYIYETKTIIYDSLSDANNEVKYLKKFTALKDSLNNANNNLQIEELKTQYETEKKEAEIVKLSKDNEIKSLQVEKDAATKTKLIIIIVSIAIVALLLIWLAVFLSKTIKERKAAYIKLQEKNIEIQKQSEQLSHQAKLISKYQSQMNPHFVFNALNSIQGTVINDEKDKTIDRLQLLSQLMRQTLNNSENEYITLETEINYLKTYFEFEKQKFKTNLRFEVTQPEEPENILLPPMMIQPFIENSIKHAGLDKFSDALIRLDISIEEDLLKIVIKDNGEGFDARDGAVLKKSHAVNIIQSRLQLMFITEKESADIKFTMRSKPELERGTEIQFYLPLNYKY